MTGRKPCELFPISEFIKEECAARGWSEDRFCARFVMFAPYTASVGWLVAEMLMHCAHVRGIVLSDEEAEALGNVFGTGPEIWMNLHNGYQLWLEERCAIRGSRNINDDCCGRCR